MVSVDDQQEVLHALYKEPVLGPFKDDLQRQKTSPRDPLMAA